jgi:hypothetical protein
MKTILLSFGFVLLCFYFYDSDGFSATLFGKENKTYFVDENSGWPYKSYKKEPGYEYFIKDDKVCKRRSSNTEQNQGNEEDVQKGTDLKTCTICDGEGIIDYCTFCRNHGNTHCSSCRGYGNIDGRTCQNCSGSGLLVCYNCEGNPKHSKCHGCDGTGQTKNIFVECIKCEGTKTMECVANPVNGVCESCNNTGVKNCYYCDGVGGFYQTVSSKE